MLCGFVIHIAIPMFGCEKHDAYQSMPLSVMETFGSTGNGLGQFVYPRGIAIDESAGFIYIVDKTARIQRFSFGGDADLIWTTPESKYGKPTGLQVASDGRLYVADTHYHRILIYDRDGRELDRFGQYGNGPRQFIQPTDVAFGPQGRIYVSEFGGNDRVQIFSSDWKYIGEFGSHGSARDQFNMPRALAFDDSRSELYIADARNHRIVVTDANGETLRTFGSAGRGPGQLAYPYDVEVLADGSVLVCEFGNQRIQHFSPDGDSLGILGRVGTGLGELQYPWRICRAADRIFVLDSGNDRVQVISPLPAQ